MDKVRISLTVFFEDPFWVGVYERVTNEKLEVSKIVFGAEPKDYEVYQYLLVNWSQLRFSPPVEAFAREQTKINPKRMQRAIQRQLGDTGVGTKAQQALKLKQEQNKMERKACNRKKREAEKERQFELRQIKKKAKHRGR
ncbi:MAG: YjdF family protein [Thermotaleaceae bacterium]